MLPGFGGRADQPVLVALEQALRARGVPAVRVALTRGRPSRGLADEVSQARAWLRADPEIAAYAGRSFGGRVLARLAVEAPPRALVLLGFPVRSAAGQRRLEDERVLATLACPTLVVQGAADPLGPVPTLERLAARNPRLELIVLRGATHAFGRQERIAVATAADWLVRRLS
ncbi:MAG TPA: alpha/beta family hydrolase [Myxococcaceae bacterium]|jgi:predicted alpha/beta-hydrolase family hydrolase